MRWLPLSIRPTGTVNVPFCLSQIVSLDVWANDYNLGSLVRLQRPLDARLKIPGASPSGANL